MSYLKFVFTFLRETTFSIILIFVLSEILTRHLLTDTKSDSLLWLYICTQIVKTGFTDTVQVYRRNVHGRNITHVKVEERVTPNRRISVLVKTDGWTDGRTDGLTDICPSRAASSQLKRLEKSWQNCVVKAWKIYRTLKRGVNAVKSTMNDSTISSLFSHFRQGDKSK